MTFEEWRRRFLASGDSGPPPSLRVFCHACDRPAGKVWHQAPLGHVLLTVERWDTSATSRQHGLVTFPNTGRRTIDAHNLLLLPRPGSEPDLVAYHCQRGHLVEVDLAIAANAAAQGRRKLIVGPPLS